MWCAQGCSLQHLNSHGETLNTLGLTGVQGSPQLPSVSLPGFYKLVRECSTVFISSPKVIFSILCTRSSKPIHTHTHTYTPHLLIEPAFDWLSTMIYFINKDTPLPWEELSLKSRQMFLIRTKRWNNIHLLLLLLYSLLDLNQDTKTHLDKRKPWFKA